jgi:hypothetical protein
MVWFYLRSEHDLMWAAPGEILSNRERYTIQSPKFVVTIVWNPSNYHVLKALPKWSKFNAQYDTNNVIVATLDWRRLSWRMQQGTFWLHADNFHPHMAKVSTGHITRNGMKRAPRSPDSPDLAPSDFFVFGYVR